MVLPTNFRIHPPKCRKLVLCDFQPFSQFFSMADFQLTSFSEPVFKFSGANHLIFISLALPANSFFVCENSGSADADSSCQ